jgi:hypothetical protein
MHIINKKKTFSFTEALSIPFKGEKLSAYQLEL